jgi:hypothetical protein
MRFTDYPDADTIKACQELNKESGMPAKKTHGMTGSKAYECWRSMLKRCYSSNGKTYKRYGDRGIEVCQEWRDSFDAFLQDMGEPKEGLSLDRGDNSGPYCKSNCRWADQITQQSNRDITVRLTVDGETKTLTEWARITKTSHFTLRTRKNRGLTDKEVVYGRIA